MLAGATATGKTGLSLALADHLDRHGPGAEIISADSRQVYRSMDIGTAKVSVADRARVPHHGLDLVDPEEAFTAADFRAHALEALAGIAARGRVAILAGGTGLYLRIVGRGVPIEESGHDPAVRAELDALLAREGPAELMHELLRIAPGIAGRTDLSNPPRVVRALERARLLGDVPPPTPVGYPAPSVWLGTRLDRADHDRVILERIREQFAGGLLDEARHLRERHGTDVRSWSAMGYREAFAVIDGRWDPDTAIAEVALRTRRYARRQDTWFRAEPDIAWLPEEASARLAAAIVAVEPLLERSEPPAAPQPVS